jgi:hypothetical protein
MPDSLYLSILPTWTRFPEVMVNVFLNLRIESLGAPVEII